MPEETSPNHEEPQSRIRYFLGEVAITTLLAGVTYVTLEGGSAILGYHFPSDLLVPVSAAVGSAARYSTRQHS